MHGLEFRYFFVWNEGNLQMGWPKLNVIKFLKLIVESKFKIVFKWQSRSNLLRVISNDWALIQGSNLESLMQDARMIDEL